MSEPRYGSLDEAQLRRLGSDRNLVLDGKPYRIAELVPQMDGTARYQAWPIPEGMDPDRVVFMPGTGPVEIGGPLSDDAPAGAREDTTTGVAEAMTVVPDDKLPAPPVEAGPRPRLADWARVNGWKGHGPIPKDVRARYQDEFGAEG